MTQVWALASGNDGAMAVSGSGDGTIAFWKDDTEAKQLAHQAELAEEMEMSQQLDNLVREKQLGAAFKLAIRLQKVCVRARKREGRVDLADGGG